MTCVSFFILAARLAAAQGVTLVPPGSSPAQLAIPGTGTSNHESSELGPNEVEKNPAAVAAAAAAAVVAAKLNGNSSSSERPESMGSSGKSVQEDSKMETDDEECKKKQEEEDDKAKEIQKVQDKSRPVSSTPVPGTPWYVLKIIPRSSCNYIYKLSILCESIFQYHMFILLNIAKF